MPTRSLHAAIGTAERRLGPPLAAFRASVGGVAAVEFALVLPIMVTLLLGMSEITHAVNVDRKLTLVSRSLADLTSRDKEVDSNFLDDAFKAATVIMQPFDASKLQMTVSAMEVSKPSSTSYTMKALWSCARGPSAEAKSTSTVYSDVPLGFRNATGTTDGTKSYHMHIEVKLPYTPMFGTAISGTINLSESTPWPIRVDGAVRLKDNLCPAAA